MLRGRRNALVLSWPSALAWRVHARGGGFSLVYLHAANVLAVVSLIYRPVFIDRVCFLSRLHDCHVVMHVIPGCAHAFFSRKMWVIFCTFDYLGLDIFG